MMIPQLFPSSSILFLSCCFLVISSRAPGANANKQLVFFAGPHQSGASSVEKFYHNYLSGYNNAKTSEGLDGWIWPRVQGNLGLDYDDWDRQKVFNFLVTHADDEGVQEGLMQSITQAYSKAKEGVLIGTEEFDRIGDTRKTQRDGLMAMEKIVNTLHVAQEDVWVILNYRTPRVDQWIGFWKKDGQDSDYKTFLCEEYDRLFERMETAMNPLGLAQTIREQTGWNVVLIDLVGVQDIGADVSHVIACEILGNTDCRNGFVSDRYNKTFHLNHIEKDIDGLGDDQIDDLEMLLRQRDCAYKERLSNDHAFYTLHESTLWQGCNTEHDDIYQQLTDTTTILDLVRSQEKCDKSSSGKLDINDFLVGDIAALTYKKDVETLKQENAAYSFENLEDVEKDEDHAKAADRKETIKKTTTKGSESSSDKSFHFGWIFGFALLGAAGYRVYVTKMEEDHSNRLWNTSREHKQQAYRPRDDDLDAEYGFSGGGGFRDDASDVASDEEASQEELEMSPTKSSFPDWRDSDDDDDTDAEMNRLNQNKMMMQMPKRKSALMAPAPGKKNYQDGFDLSWAQGHEIESSEEENSDSEFEDEH